MAVVAAAPESVSELLMKKQNPFQRASWSILNVDLRLRQTLGKQLRNFRVCDLLFRKLWRSVHKQAPLTEQQLDRYVRL